MNDAEKYEFDRLGYIVIKQLLKPDEAARLAAATDDVEAHALSRIDVQKAKASVARIPMRIDDERHYHASGHSGEGNTLMIEDFWNAHPDFDLLLDHKPTMSYIDDVIIGRSTINNSEIRIRYPGNSTSCHMGGPIGHKYRYGFNEGRIDCMMVRMIYFLHDVGMDDGPFSVVPATHKSNLNAPWGGWMTMGNPDEEPGMIGLPVEAGDAILFTENLRHGGLTNRSHKTRKTLHVGYGPYWMLSQNTATIDEPQHITDTTRSRLTEAQNNLFRTHTPEEKRVVA